MESLTEMLSYVHMRNPSNTLSFFLIVFEASSNGGHELCQTNITRAVFVLIQEAILRRDMSAVQHYAPSQHEKKRKHYRLSVLRTETQLANGAWLNVCC